MKQREGVDCAATCLADPLDGSALRQQQLRLKLCCLDDIAVPSDHQCAAVQHQFLIPAGVNSVHVSWWHDVKKVLLCKLRFAESSLIVEGSVASQQLMHTLQGDPVYSSQRVRFTFGGVPCFESQGQPLPAASIVACEQAAAAVDAGWRQAAWSALGTCSEGQGSCRSPSPDAGPARRWVTQEFEMRPHDGLQTFQLNPGVLCVGGHLQVCTVARPAHRTPDCVPRSWQISACSTGHASCLKASAAVLHDQSPKA